MKIVIEVLSNFKFARNERESRSNRVYCHLLLPLVEQVEESARSWFVRVSPTVSRKHQMKPVHVKRKLYHVCNKGKLMIGSLTILDASTIEPWITNHGWLVVQCK
jgi:hypothetical protein